MSPKSHSAFKILDISWAVQTYNLGSYNSISHFQKGSFYPSLALKRHKRSLNSTLKTQAGFVPEAFRELRLIQGIVLRVGYARQKSFICLKPKVVTEQVTSSMQATQMNSKK